MIILKKIITYLGSVILNFIYFWWKDSFFWLSEKQKKIILKIKKIFAVKVNLRYLFTPLYQDYTIRGYAIGIPARIIRVILGIIVYLIIISMFLFIYLFWASIPFLIILEAIKSLS